MFDRVLITPLPFLVKLQAFILQPTTLLKDGLLHKYFSKIWQLSRNTYLKEHFWKAALKETDVIKKRCENLWITL